MRLPTRGFYRELEPPIPVDVLEGRIKGTLTKPIAGYVPKPGVTVRVATPPRGVGHAGETRPAGTRHEAGDDARGTWRCSPPWLVATIGCSSRGGAASATRSRPASRPATAAARRAPAPAAGVRRPRARPRPTIAPTPAP